jgi:PEP-CTERM motif
MRKNFVSTVLRTSAFATACLALAGSNVKAATMTSTTGTTTTTVTPGEQVYSTSGSIGTSGISSPDGATPSQAISFTPTVSFSYTGTSAISLGQFQVATLAAGAETDYNNTPFSITYNPVSFGGLAYPGSTTPITITGVLNGAITGGTSSVVATFDSISNPAFASPDGSTLSTISIANSPLNLVPSSAGGVTSVQALVASTAAAPAGTGGTNPVPEPTTFAILATALVGLGLRKQLRKARLAD